MVFTMNEKRRYNKKNKAFICRKCGTRQFATHINQHRCKRCGQLICKKCMVAKGLCADCFVMEDTQDYNDYLAGVQEEAI